MSNTNTIATKTEVIAAGKALASRSTPAQQTNHAKVIAWIERLDDVPSTTNPETSYKMLIQQWVKAQGIK